MPVRKQSYSLDERAASYVDRRAKKQRQSASSVLSEIVLEAALVEARTRVLADLDTGAAVSEVDVRRWLKKLGAT